MDPFSNRDEYRARTGGKDLILTRVTEDETDLAVYGLCRLKRETAAAARAIRKVITEEIQKRPAFLTSLVPLEPEGDEAEPILHMMKASRIAGTGPMAAVAGLIAETVGKEVRKMSGEIIVENGGDIFLSGEKERTVAVFAGTSSLSGKIGIRINPGSGYGVCTSSGTYGHSLSFGKADAAIILAEDAALSDAAATMLGNKCTSEEVMKDAVEWACSLPCVDGAIAIMGEQIAVAGEYLAGRIVSLG